MNERALVLPSPLLGPAAYRPLARALGEHGWVSAVAGLPPGPFTPEQVRDGFARAATEAQATVVIAHSNAGNVAAAVAEAAEVGSVLYVDAALPPRDGPCPLAPPALLDGIRHLADADGLMAPWTRWWPHEDVLALVPSPAWLERIEAEQPRVTVSYLSAMVAVPTGWWHRPSGYLAFGTTYAAQLDAARGYGWPVETLEGHHLDLLTDPEGVAVALRRLHARVITGR